MTEEPVVPSPALTTALGPLRIIHAPPTAAGRLFEEIFDQHSGVQTVAAAGDFTGLGLNFAVIGAGARIDAATGVVSIPTHAALSGEMVTVTASNSGGSAASGFMVTIEAAETEVETPPALTAGQWDVYWDHEPAAPGFDPTRVTWHFSILSGPAFGAERLFWRADVTDPDPRPGAGYHICARHPALAHVWVARSLSAACVPGAADFLRCDGDILGRTRSHGLAYSLDPPGAVAIADSAYSDVSDTKTKVVTPPAKAPAWRLLRYRTRAEVDAGLYYGDPEQFQQCVARSKSDPNRIYLGQDVGPIRRSDDGGATWKVCVARGLRNAYFLGGAVDPVNRDVFMVQCHNRLGAKAERQAGIWRTTDGGVTFTRAQATAAVGEPRIVADTLAHAPGSIDATGARRWYCAFAARPLRDDAPGDSGFWMSDDYGATWTRQARALPPGIYGKEIYCVAVSPSDQAVIWMGTGTGLFTSVNQGADWEPVANSGAGARVPAGACTHIEIDPANAGRIFTSFHGAGGYYTDDAFATAATELFAAPNMHRAFPHPADWNVCVRLPVRGGGYGRFDQAEVSGNALARLAAPAASCAWTRCEVPERPGARGGWWSEITGEPSAVRWHPTDPSSAFASARGHLFRTSDRINWSFANEGVSGFNYGNASTSTEFMFDHLDAARIFMPHADVGILATTDRFSTYDSVTDGYRDLRLGGKATATTCNVCALQPLAGSRKLVAAVGDYNASTIVYSPDAGASWVRTGPSAGKSATMVRCWGIHYALTEPRYCYVHRHRSENGGESFTELAALARLGKNMMVIGVSRKDAGPDGPAIYAADHGGNPAYAKVYKSVDRGASWVLAYAYSRGSLRGAPGNAFDGPVFRVDPLDPHAFIAAAPTGARGAADGSISRYDTVAGSWTHYDVWRALGRTDGNFVSRIAIDWNRAARAPSEPLILYVQLAHVGMRNVLRSTDAGATWENMTYDSTNAVGQGFEVHPLTGELFSGGEAGTRMLRPPYATIGTVGEQTWSRPNNIALTA